MSSIDPSAVGQYYEAAVRGDHELCSSVIEQLLSVNGCTLRQLYAELFTPVQRRIGTEWAEGRLGIVEEHLATQITITEMGSLRSRFTPSRKVNRKISLICVPGDEHTIAARMVADLFYIAGWTDLLLGESLPTEELLRHLRQTRPHALGISVVRKESLKRAKEMISAVRRLQRPPAILVGGYAVDAYAAEAALLDADGLVGSADDPVDAAWIAIGKAPQEERLEYLLEDIGVRVHELRRATGMSQGELAQAAGLDRTYVSSIERGQQNISLSIVLKLADALGVQIEKLLMG